jgi:hypothetical protein
MWTTDEVRSSNPAASVFDFDPLYTMCHGDSIAAAYQISGLWKPGGLQTEKILRDWITQRFRKILHECLKYARHFSSTELDAIGHAWTQLCNHTSPTEEDFDMLRSLLLRDNRLISVLCTGSSHDDTIKGVMQLLQADPPLDLCLDHEIHLPYTSGDTMWSTVRNHADVVNAIVAHPKFNTANVNSDTGFSFLEHKALRSMLSESLPVETFVNKFIAQNEGADAWNRFFNTTHAVLRQYLTNEQISSPLITCLNSHGVTRSALLTLSTIDSVRAVNEQLFAEVEQFAQRLNS